MLEHTVVKYLTSTSPHRPVGNYIEAAYSHLCSDIILRAKVYPSHGPLLLGTVENLLSNHGKETFSRWLRVDMQPFIDPLPREEDLPVMVLLAELITTYQIPISSLNYSLQSMMTPHG